MRLLFVHDHKFRRINNKFYSIGGLNDEALERYTKVFDDVDVYARIIDEDSNSNRFSEITNKKVNIYGSNEFSILKLISLINDSDKVIIRLPSFNGLYVISFCKIMRKDYLIEVVGCAWDSLWNHGLKGKIIAPFITLLNKYEIKKASHVIYVTEKFLQKRYPTNGENTNCSNVSLPSCDENILKKRLLKINSSFDKIIIGTTAALDVKYKGQERVIQVLGELKKEGITNFEYQLVGNGEKKYLENLAKKYNVENQVVFIGGLPHDKVFEWLDSIDIYIQPSKQEGLPRALIEAMSRGLPCIGANTAGIPELLEAKYIFSNKKIGIIQMKELILKYDVEKMNASAMRNFEESKKYQKEIIESRRNKFLIKFSERKH